MAAGPGKYDDVATMARKATDARAVVLIIVNGDRGSGFSVQRTEDMALALPVLLRQIADDLETEDGQA